MLKKIKGLFNRLYGLDKNDIIKNEKNIIDEDELNYIIGNDINDKDINDNIEKIIDDDENYQFLLYESDLDLAITYEDNNDYELAIKHYKDALEYNINKGYIYNIMGLIYKDKLNDLKNAEEYLIKSKEEGNINSIYNLAMLYLVKDDYIKVHKLLLEYNNELENLKRDKDYDSYYILGYIYEKYYKDIQYALFYYKIGADNNHEMSALNIGINYNNMKEYDLGTKYLKIAAELGNSLAMFNLGSYYKNIFKDIYIAEKYYKMSAIRGNKDACNNLGLLYHQMKNFKESRKYLQKAIKLGSEEAITNYDLLIKKNKKKIL